MDSKSLRIEARTRDGRVVCAMAPEEKTVLVAAKNPPPIFYDFDPENVESVKLRHILVETEVLADDIIELVKSERTSLRDLAPGLSICEISKANGGDLGWFEQGSEDLEPEILEIVFLVRPNTLQKVKSKRGWHVLVVEDARHTIQSSLSKRGAPVPLTQIPRNQRAAIPEMIKGTYCVQTMGCQMNQADSEKMSGVG